MYSDHHRDPKFVTVVDRWSLLRCRFMSVRPKLGLQNGDRCRQVVVIRRLLLAQVWLCTFSFLGLVNCMMRSFKTMDYHSRIFFAGSYWELSTSWCNGYSWPSSIRETKDWLSCAWKWISLFQFIFLTKKWETFHPEIWGCQHFFLSFRKNKLATYQTPRQSNYNINYYIII